MPLSAKLPGGLADLGTPGSPALITAENRQIVLQPNLSAPAKVANGQVTLPFSSIPGRSYDLMTSTNLSDWAWAGTTTATDFTAQFTPELAAEPMRFFRVMTP